jgi:hypothetical protein
METDVFRPVALAGSGNDPRNRVGVVYRTVFRFRERTRLTDLGRGTRGTHAREVCQRDVRMERTIEDPRVGGDPQMRLRRDLGAVEHPRPLGLLLEQLVSAFVKRTRGPGGRRREVPGTLSAAASPAPRSAWHPGAPGTAKCLVPCRGCYLFTSSTRRFLARPSALSFEATGA